MKWEKGSWECAFKLVEIMDPYIELNFELPGDFNYSLKEGAPPEAVEADKAFRELSPTLTPLR